MLGLGSFQFVIKKFVSNCAINGVNLLSGRYISPNIKYPAPLSILDFIAGKRNSCGTLKVLIHNCSKEL
ncbi:MAG TPA: hypothetical protein PKE03_05955, partial [Bacteroidales bacterium]|nr:hypothetical protein [Bacteroidales bacterium]